jgi:hypothetical protein
MLLNLHSPISSLAHLPSAGEFYPSYLSLSFRYSHCPQIVFSHTHTASSAPFVSTSKWKRSGCNAPTSSPANPPTPASQSTDHASQPSRQPEHGSAPFEQHCLSICTIVSSIRHVRDPVSTPSPPCTLAFTTLPGRDERGEYAKRVLLTRANGRIQMRGRGMGGRTRPERESEREGEGETCPSGPHLGLIDTRSENSGPNSFLATFSHSPARSCQTRMLLLSPIVRKNSCTLLSRALPHLGQRARTMAMDAHAHARPRTRHACAALNGRIPAARLLHGMRQAGPGRAGLGPTRVRDADSDLVLHLHLPAALRHARPPCARAPCTPPTHPL